MELKEQIENKDSNEIPLVSVLIGTYQHAEFIRECIESVLGQKTNFPFEIIIGEDESTDGTREICLEYKKKYPEKIQLFLRSRKDVIFIDGNPTGRFNFIENLKAAKGKYTALLDGDDFWTDPHKLQRQFEILETHPECIACHHWHKLSIRNAEGKFELQEAAHRENHGYLNQEISPVNEIFKFRMRTQTRTLMFRNIFTQEKFPAWFSKVRFGDLSLALILGKYGKFYFIDEELAAYRVTGKGVSTLFNNEKGYISGNKSWLEIWACALEYHEYNFIDDALVGMNVFLTRIRNHTENSFSVRFDLIAFILLKLKMKYSVKRKLVKSLMQAVKTNL